MILIFEKPLWYIMEHWLIKIAPYSGFGMGIVKSIGSCLLKPRTFQET